MCAYRRILLWTDQSTVMAHEWFRKDIMVQNIDSILQRGERLDLLVDKTDTLAGQAYAFRRGARSVRRQQWWRNIRIMALTGVVGVVSVSRAMKLVAEIFSTSVDPIHIHCAVLRRITVTLPPVALDPVR